jgi:hypothetical protein
MYGEACPDPAVMWSVTGARVLVKLAAVLLVDVQILVVVESFLDLDR